MRNRQRILVGTFFTSLSVGKHIVKTLYNRLIFGTALTLFLSSTTVALRASESDAILKGSWAGRSNIVDSHGDPGKVYVSASAGAVTLRFELPRDCVIEGLSGAPKLDATNPQSARWDLTVTSSSDNDSCSRIAKGALSLHKGQKSGPLSFEARYENAAGGQIERNALLGRYP